MFQLGDKVVFKPKVRKPYDYSKAMTVIEVFNTGHGQGLTVMTSFGPIILWDASCVMLAQDPPPKLRLLRKERIK